MVCRRLGLGLGDSQPGRTGQRLRISLISTRIPQPIHRVTTALRQRSGGGGAGLQSRAGLTTLEFLFRQS